MANETHEEFKARVGLMDAAERKRLSLESPFDKRSEISADARYIVKHLWIIGVGVPAVLGAVTALLLSMR
jgi:ElaB/YqjD/DUF883 family membrane-anchored ribosome-binding protein